jgi:L-fucose mutarotase
VLKGIDPLLGADLLGPLAAMGHGDLLAVVDRNFPAASTAQRLVVVPVDVVTAARAVLTVFPVDTFDEPAVLRMGAVGDEETVLPVHAALQAEVDAAEGRTVPSAPLARFDFYARARTAYLTVATTEDRPYGCFLLTKGVV